MAGGPRAGLLTHFYEKGERQLGAFFAAAFDSAQSAAFDSVCCTITRFCRQVSYVDMYVCM